MYVCMYICGLTLEGVAALDRTLRCQAENAARDLLSRKEFVAGEQAVTIFIS